MDSLNNKNTFKSINPFKLLRNNTIRTQMLDRLSTNIWNSFTEMTSNETKQVDIQKQIKTVKRTSDYFQKALSKPAKTVDFIG